MMRVVGLRVLLLTTLCSTTVYVMIYEYHRRTLEVFNASERSKLDAISESNLATNGSISAFTIAESHDMPLDVVDDEEIIARQLQPRSEHGNIPYKKVFVQLSSNTFGDALFKQSTWLNRNKDKEKYDHKRLQNDSTKSNSDVDMIGSTNASAIPNSSSVPSSNETVRHRIYEESEKQPLTLSNLYPIFLSPKYEPSRPVSPDTPAGSSSTLGHGTNSSFENFQTRVTTPNTNVIFYSYLRGGSSIGSHVFSLDLDTFFWYEPLDAFYSAHFGIPQCVIPGNQLYYNNGTKRELLFEERRWLVSFFRNLFECKLYELPPDVFAHAFRHKSDNLRGFTTCYESTVDRVSLDLCRSYTAPLCGETIEDSIANQCHVILRAAWRIREALPYRRSSDFKVKAADMVKYVGILRDSISSMRVIVKEDMQYQLHQFVTHQLCVNAITTQISKCLPRAVDQCQKSGLHVVKVLRLRFDELEELTFLYPKLKVIYFARDPRGIAYSRAKTNLVKSKRDPSYIEEAKFVCLRLRNDLKKKAILDSRYPDKVFSTKYESMARDPIGYARDVYRFLGRAAPEHWLKFVQAMYKRKKGDDPYGLIRNNPMKTATAWKRATVGFGQDNMYATCKNELAQLQYDP